MSGRKYCRSLILILIIGGIGASVGCALRPLDDAVWPERRLLGQELEANLPPGSLTVQSDISFIEPTGSLSLRDALAAALLRSPDLAAEGYEVRAREAEALQAGLLPNPELGIEMENFGGSGPVDDFDALESTLVLSQLVELGGKRIKRHRLAVSNAHLAGWEYEIRRIDIFSKTAMDFVRLLAAERQLRIAYETRELAQRVFDAVGERVDAGKISPVERTKARVEYARAELEHERAMRTVTASRYRLCSNWGSIDPQFDSLTGDFDSTESLPELDSLLTRVEQNPELARWTAEAARRQAEVELALAQRIPDLTLTGGVRHFNEFDETAFIAGLSMPLPIFDRNQGDILAARLRVFQGDSLEESTRVKIYSAVVQAFQFLDAALLSVQITRDKILPSAEIAFEAAEEAFRQGKIGALSLLDAERTLFEARRQLTDALTSYHLAVIANERLIGAPLNITDQSQGNTQ